MELKVNQSNEFKDINEQWENFSLCGSDSDESVDNSLYEVYSADITKELTVPVASNIYVSTTTKIASLCESFDLNTLFWKIPVISYVNPINGVVKKQMKINSTSVEDIELMKVKLNNTEYYKEHILASIDNPFGRIKFKDVRKISIGICKKDILNHRSKEKSAFYNCFVLMIRMKVDNVFKEYHVKVFNTGKVTVPGVRNEESFIDVINLTTNILQPYVSEKLEYIKNTSKTILINTNFNCGYYINREKLHDILCQKYNIQCELDSCNYPGVRCIFYYDPDANNQKGYIEKKNMHKNIKKISFMIFRTGSVLISGTHHNCKECVLTIVYDFLKRLLHNEYLAIRQINVNFEPKKEKQKKIRRKKITVSI